MQPPAAIFCLTQTTRRSEAASQGESAKSIKGCAVLKGTAYAETPLRVSQREVKINAYSKMGDGNGDTEFPMSRKWLL
jgi:hypothetical protein